MRELPVYIYVAVIIIKYVEAGVITSASDKRIANNYLNEQVQYPEDNDILNNFALPKEPPFPTKYWIIKNIPLFKKIPKEFAKTAKKLTKYPDAFYKDLYGINKIEEKAKTRMHNLIKSNVILNDDSQQSTTRIDSQNYEDKVKDSNQVNSVEDVAEISLSDEATTEDNILPMEDEVVSDNQKILNDFIRSHTVILTNSDCHSDSSEEKKDLDEFIFMLDDRESDDDIVNEADVEDTTPFIVEEPRIKRRVNMIEEENMGTTVTGFKYTGNDARLSNNLYFKNINS